MHSDKGGITLEPFTGSGTTIIAAKQLEGSCLCLEISPITVTLRCILWRCVYEF
ncbi:DNA methyltransferase [Thermanaerosceptrum fracticalcis]|uniref:DNA methyltransferase n=1 Tax=Thermanaerosceptrum fracticalcis TaxID=1712410 RepID=UPI001FAB6D7F|nr:DNA methyltransferase [Thermanaerosceptrum fracticalcis]